MTYGPGGPPPQDHGQQGPPWEPRYYDPRQPPQWGQPFPPPRRRSWPRRHKILSALIAILVALVALVVLSSIGSQPKARPAAAAGLAACSSHHAVTSRQWLEIAKDPATAEGQCVTVYGEITQFDSVTGAAEFRASVGGASIAPTYGYVSYPTNVIIDGSSAELGPLVEGDLFTAQVTIAGTQEYTTVAGGSTTVPLLRADSVKRTGHLSN